MGARPGLTAAIALLLADRKWHSLTEICAVAYTSVRPEVAYRIACCGLSPTAPMRGDFARAVDAGRRSRVLGTLRDCGMERRRMEDGVWQYKRRSISH
jgi:hypothetical protein